MSTRNKVALIICLFWAGMIIYAGAAMESYWIAIFSGMAISTIIPFSSERKSCRFLQSKR